MENNHTTERKVDVPSGLPQMFYGVAEKKKSQPIFRQFATHFLQFPLRVIFRIQISLRMRHKAENAARRVAQTGDGIQGSVGIPGKFLRRFTR